MSVYVETAGEGRDIVLLHGWGLHGGVFGPLADALASRCRVHAVDLPGHGRTRVAAGPDLRGWARAVLDTVPANAAWLGWSLGGLVALRAALDAPDAVERLVLVAATPRFIAAPGWEHAQRPEMLERFGADLATDFRRTVQDFLTLQALGDVDAREQVRHLRTRLFAHGDPDPQGLADGLAILRDADLRDELPRVRVPALVVAGARDRLTPPAASEALAAALPRADVTVIPRVAHAPFLNDPVGFAARVVEFVDAA